MNEQQNEQHEIENLRSRTFSWSDPHIALQQSKTMSGLDYMRALQQELLPPPPIAQLIGMRLQDVEEGRIVFVLEAAEYHYNPLGTMHGGIIATLLDSSMGCAVQTLLPVGTGYTTIELKTNYLRPISARTGTLFSEGKIIHIGGRIATTEARLTDSSGKLYAHGTSSCIILRP